MRHLDGPAVLTDPVLLTLVLRRHRTWLVVLVHGVLLASVSGTVARALDDLPGLGPLAVWPAASAMYAPPVGAVFDPFAEWRERSAAAPTRFHAVTWLAPASLLVAAVFRGPPEMFRAPRWWTSLLVAVLGAAGLAGVAGLVASVDRRWGRYGHART